MRAIRAIAAYQCPFVTRQSFFEKIRVTHAHRKDTLIPAFQRHFVNSQSTGAPPIFLIVLILRILFSLSSRAEHFFGATQIPQKS